MADTKLITERFQAKFGSVPRICRAPGRVNLIGEHTDYNDGFVMPAAIGFYCWIAVGPRTDHRLAICSQEFHEDGEFELSPESLRPSHSWSDYPLGVAMHLQKAGFRLTGANLLLHGEVPIGAGLSSSASVEVATAMALAELSGLTIDHLQLAQICQQAEADFVGMKCGIMDQFISLQGKRSHVMLLDCRSLHFEFVPLPDSVRLVVCNTGVKHQLTGGEYNRRRKDCDEAVASLQRALPKIRALRDVTAEELERHRGLLSETSLIRARHVISENARVLDAAEALRHGNLRKCGAVMNASHESLRDDYQVSCLELDLMVELARQQEGLYGARMTGGGFGGSTVNLVDAQHAESFASEISSAYQARTGIVPRVYVCMPVDGATRVETETLYA